MSYFSLALLWLGGFCIGLWLGIKIGIKIAIIAIKIEGESEKDNRYHHSTPSPD